MSNWRPVEIDESVTRFGQSTFIHVQDADYLLQCTKVEPSPEDRDYSQADPYFRFHLQLADGPEGIGKTITYTGMITAAKADGSGGSWSLGRIVDALGFDAAALANTKFPTWKHLAGYAAALTKRMAGKKTGAEIREGPYVTSRGETIMISNITGFFPEGEWALRQPKVPVATAPLAPTTTRAAGATSGSASTAPAASPTSNGSTNTPEAPEGEFDIDALIAQMNFEKPTA